MQKVIKVIVVLFALLGLVYAAMLAIFLSGQSRGSSCLTYPVLDVPSPDSNHRATVENKSCGSSELRTEVQLRGNKERVEGGSGVVLFHGPTTTRADTGSYSLLSLRLLWLSDSHLEVALPRSAKFRRDTDSFDGVTVTYKELEP